MGYSPWGQNDSDTTDLLNTHAQLLRYPSRLPAPPQLIIQLPSRVQLWLHGLQHARLPCPSLSPGVCEPVSLNL